MATVKALVVAGGGGAHVGGGGAGGYQYDAALTTIPQSYTVTVGGGGAYETAGGNSIFSTITANGGGHGGITGALDGGCGGGGYGNQTGGTGSQGGNGGNGAAGSNGGGGGGGASANGSSGANTVGGNGGNGTANSISGASITYAGGGGASGGTGHGNGGTGGGGDGATGSGTAGNGTANTGGGGGGSFGVDGSGGSGIVIVRWTTADFGICSVTGTGNTITTNGADSIATMIVSGNLVLGGKFTNPANIYASDNVYATLAATSGILTVEVSKDAGANWQTPKTVTFTGSDSLQTCGTGSTELWGSSFTRADMVDANFRVRLSQGNISQVYKTFGFSTGSDILTGIEIAIEGNYASSTLSLDLLEVRIYFGSTILPVGIGSMAYASNGRKAGQGAGTGTGVLVSYDGNQWNSSEGGVVAA